VFLEDLKKHLSEAIDGIGREALGVGEMTDGIKGTIDIGRAINQKKFRTIRHGNRSQDTLRVSFMKMSNAKVQIPN
jgi:hypothetical protein